MILNKLVWLILIIILSSYSGATYTHIINNLGILQPNVEIVYPANNSIIYNQTITVIGYASDRYNMTSMEWIIEGEQGSYSQNKTLENTTRIMNFMIEVYLFEGRNTITVIFRDTQGFEGNDSVTVVCIPDNPPSKPSKPVGPTEGEIGEVLTYSTIANDPDSDKIRYGWDFNDDNIVDEWSTLLESNTTCRLSYIWDKAGIYHVKVKAVDEKGVESSWSENLTVTISTPSNNPPSKPTITGPTKGRVGGRYEYTFVAIDPDGDNIYYFVDWGDNTSSGWLGPYKSGEEITLAHSFSSQGSYAIKAKAEDIFGDESSWGTLIVNMPYNILIHRFLGRILNLLSYFY
ncbi:MAG: hypothetical protein DRN12_07465 [Thermoplasmata archaeon]|nr:MAG: hypothetical protein DRN12_07465 [Thermoplasmata archaeon]